MTRHKPQKNFFYRSIISQVPEPFSDKEASLDSSGSLDYNKDAKKDVEIDISTSNIKEQVHHPIIQLEGRNIDDLWNDYKNLTQEQFKTLTAKYFIETFRKFLKDSDFSDKSDKSLETSGVNFAFPSRSSNIDMILL
ncbi:hypothetical protein RhiirA4_418073 [Rhizophagus irregularis]|uniref:Uncharacterized protein n=1 Tax=Rhizophagus irregularis TaxID=588596 RepID=A0A2I1G9A7_9GLOM|nr:hypothetical protein RhiirA4_418073 [Rhizophagus irregularis]